MIELDGDEWSVAYAPLGATRHKSSKSSQAVTLTFTLKQTLALTVTLSLTFLTTQL